VDNTTTRITRRRFFATAAVAATGAAASGATWGGYFQQKAPQRSAKFLSGQIFANPTFDFTTRTVLGTAYYACANPGKVFAITSSIQDGDYEFAYRAFSDAGNEAKLWANEAVRKNQHVSAYQAYLWAANYLYASLYFLDGTADPNRMFPTWQDYESCWTAAAALSAPAIERVEIPYENTVLTGWFFRPSEAKKRRRPLVILNNGSDASELAMLVAGGAAGIARGYNCLTFNGPGQGDSLWLKKLYFRPAWEKVITPVVDFAIAHREVNAKQLRLLASARADIGSRELWRSSIVLRRAWPIRAFAT